MIEQRPTPAGFVDALSDMSLESLRTFAASVGLVCHSNTKSDILGTLGYLMLRQGAYQSLSEQLLVRADGRKQSGLLLRANGNSTVDDLKGAFAHAASGQVVSKCALKCEQLQSTLDPKVLAFGFRYQRKIRASRTLVDYEGREVQARLQVLDLKTVQLICTPGPNDDYERLRDIANAVAAGADWQVHEFKLGSILLESRVQLFNDIFRQAGGDWKVEDVIGSTVRHDDDKKEAAPSLQVSEEDVDDEATDSIEVDVAPANLTIITQAVLSGKNLNTSPFVQDCIKNRHYFSSARLQTSHKKHAVHGTVSITFSQKPTTLIVEARVDDERPGAHPALEMHDSLIDHFWKDVVAKYRQYLPK